MGLLLNDLNQKQVGRVDIFESDPNEKHAGKVTIFEDNQGAIALTQNPEHHARNKHIDGRYHYCREKVERGEIEVKYLSTDVMLADALTKPLPDEKFKCFRDRLLALPETSTSIQ